MKQFLAIFALFVMVVSGLADAILYDDFEDGDLAIGDAATTNAGFGIVRDGGGAEGSAWEADGRAYLKNGSTKVTYGILSSTGVLLNNPGGVRTTWQVDTYSLTDNAAYLEFVWQSGGGYTAAPELKIIIDLQTSNMTFQVNSSQLGDAVGLDLSLLSVSTNSFSLRADFTPSGVAVASSELKDKEGVDVSFFSGWASGSPLSGTTYHVGSYIKGEGNGSTTAGIGSVLVEPIPEPAVAGLISLFGGGMIFYRRIFGRNKSGSGA